MPTIELSDADFQRLQKIAVPLVDTPETVIRKLLDSYERTNGKAPPPSTLPSASPGPKHYDARSIPPLTHTKLLAGEFDGVRPQRTTWDGLVRLALVRVWEKSGDVRELKRMAGANVVGGEKHDEGYKFLPSHGFSYQGVSAEDAAKIIVRCARALGCGACFEFEWRDKPEAHRPGQRAAVRV